MYPCRECDSILSPVNEYASHYEMHSNVHNIQFPCCVDKCPNVFKSVPAFKSHIYRSHTQENFFSPDSRVIHNCTMESCCMKFTDIKLLVKHLKQHISNGNAIQCSFYKCTRNYKNVS